MSPKSLSFPEFVLVFATGPLLAANAGFINTVVIAEGAPAVTHLTGTITRASADIGQGNFADARFVGSLALAFLLGATLSGALIGASTLRIGRRYGVAMMIESFLLLAAAIVITRSVVAGAILASAAAGLQNAMAASYRSLIVRTTHVTGTLTDLGFLMGKRLTGHPIERWQFTLLVLLLTGFVAGGVAGMLAYQRLRDASLYIPSASIGLGGVAYFVYNLRARSSRFDA